jgi:outer membrane protein OmpA-like peptidoglycan-associated protein
MKLKVIKPLVTSVVVSMLLVGCTNQPGLIGNNDNSNTKIGGIMGAIGGAVLGATKGSKKHRTQNVLLGALGGGAAGALIGYSIDQQANEVANALGTHVDNDPLATIDPNKTLIVSKGENYVKIIFRDKMMFPTNSDQITYSAKSKVNKVGTLLKQYPQTVVSVAGFTDNRGSYAYNQTLSQKRAQSVSAILHQNSPQNQITPQGCSYNKPLVPNSSKENMAMNRRVEIYLFKGNEAQVNPCNQ